MAFLLPLCLGLVLLAPSLARAQSALDVPSNGDNLSGIGVISGWVCEADEVVITLNGVPQPATYGTERRDTEAFCGDSDNGFWLVFNWNLLGDGEHTVVALVDGVELGRATVTVTTLGTEFLRAGAGTCAVEGFPSLGESVTLEWQQTTQNFVMTDGTAPDGRNHAGTPGVGYLEHPGPNSFQSGIGAISGWVCEADEVVIELGDLAPKWRRMGPSGGIRWMSAGTRTTALGCCSTGICWGRASMRWWRWSMARNWAGPQCE